jgi:benzodiazapine receptor
MTINLEQPSPRRQVLAAVISQAAALAVAALGGLATSSSVDSWYAGLEKPGFNPPNAVFAPVWTTLYVVMAVAVWRVWRASRGVDRRRAMTLYGAQLALNLLWSILFFGLREPAAALVEIVVLFALILLTTRSFWRIDRAAGLMLTPYAAWVAFASVLNFEIWRLN